MREKRRVQPENLYRPLRGKNLEFSLESRLRFVVIRTSGAGDLGYLSMIRLLLVLCVGLFAAMKIGGEDRGQLRFGLMPQAPVQSPAKVLPKPVVVADLNTVAPAPKPETVEVVNAAFIPDAPVMVAPEANEVAAVPVAAPEVTGRVMYVSVKSLNVRAGPGTDYSVMDRLKRGDEVLVVAVDEGPDSWAMIRIEGDGVEGYVSAALLSE